MPIVIMVESGVDSALTCQGPVKICPVLQGGSSPLLANVGLLKDGSVFHDYNFWKLSEFMEEVAQW